MISTFQHNWIDSSIQTTFTSVEVFIFTSHLLQGALCFKIEWPILNSKFNDGIAFAVFSTFFEENLEN